MGEAAPWKWVRAATWEEEAPSSLLVTGRVCLSRKRFQEKLGCGLEYLRLHSLPQGCSDTFQGAQLVRTCPPIRPSTGQAARLTLGTLAAPV